MNCIHSENMLICNGFYLFEDKTCTESDALLIV